jgi:hypothetical protein
MERGVNRKERGRGWIEGREAGKGKVMGKGWELGRVRRVRLGENKKGVLPRRERERKPVEGEMVNCKEMGGGNSATGGEN